MNATLLTSKLKPPADFHLNYGLIGNCQISALVSQDGSLDWLCMPRFDAPSVFAKILDDEKGGFLSIEAEHPATITQRYLTNTNVLETFYETPDYAFKVIDFVPRYHEEGHLTRSIEVHRQIEPVRGCPSVRVRFRPRPDYARATLKMGRAERSIKAETADETYYLHTNLSLENLLAEHTHMLQRSAYLILTYCDWR